MTLYHKCEISVLYTDHVLQQESIFHRAGQCVGELLCISMIFIIPSSSVTPSWHAAELLNSVVAMEMQQLYVV